MLIQDMDDEFSGDYGLQVYKEDDFIRFAIWKKSEVGKALAMKVTPEVALTFAESLIEILMKENQNENGN